MRKKILIWIYAVIILMTFTGCGKYVKLYVKSSGDETQKVQTASGREEDYVETDKQKEEVADSNVVEAGRIYDLAKEVEKAQGCNTKTVKEYNSKSSFSEGDIIVSGYSLSDIVQKYATDDSDIIDDVIDKYGMLKNLSDSSFLSSELSDLTFAIILQEIGALEPESIAYVVFDNRTAMAVYTDIQGTEYYIFVNDANEFKLADSNKKEYTEYLSYIIGGGADLTSVKGTYKNFINAESNELGTESSNVNEDYQSNSVENSKSGGLLEDYANHEFDAEDEDKFEEIGLSTYNATLAARLVATASQNATVNFISVNDQRHCTCYMSNNEEYQIVTDESDNVIALIYGSECIWSK